MKDSANHDNGQINNTDKQPIPFEVLTPTAEANISDYKSALDQAFSDAKLRNIAITGPYGSGKSSVLRSYFKIQAEQNKEPEEQYKNKSLWISLAQLHSTKEGNLETKNYENITNEDHIYRTEQLLEGKIINQVLHKVPNEVAKKVGLKPIEEETIAVSKRVYFGIAFAVTLILACSCFLPFFTVNYRSFLPQQDYITSLVFVGIILLCILAFSGLLAWLFYRNINKLAPLRSHIHRVKVADSEIELFQDSEATYFDKYLN